MTWGLDSVTVSFGDVTALDQVNLDVAAGEIAVVVGGDGAGKTTLCRTMVGLSEVDSGEVTRPARTCFQPETSGVWGDLTVLENLRLVAGAYRLDPTHAGERITELLEVTGLDQATDRLGHQLSGGMRQRLGVAMAVLSEPEMLVLDEPTTGLDPVSRLELWSFINRSAHEGRAVLISTTYVDEAERGDTILALDEGRVLASGSVESIIASMPGKLYVARHKTGANSWHRADTWRVWSSGDDSVDGANEVTPDLMDVVMVAALMGERR